MFNIFKYYKIQKELKKFREFKKTFKFEYKIIAENKGDFFCDGELVKKKDESEVAICDKWINVGYKLHDPYSKALSNLFPYTFYFKNKKVFSIESVLQGLKYKNKKEQDFALMYFGLDSNTIKICSSYDWTKTGILYWQGREIVRSSKEYDDFVEELYISALQNPLYRNVLKKIDKPYILHSIGVEEKSKTVLTRYEFEYMLNSLRAYLQKT